MPPMLNGVLTPTTLNDVSVPGAAVMDAIGRAASSYSMTRPPPCGGCQLRVAELQLVLATTRPVGATSCFGFGDGGGG